MTLLQGHMAKTDVWKKALLNLVFNNVTEYNIGSGLQGSIVPGNLYLGLYTLTPDTVTANQLSNEVTSDLYTGYVRMPVSRAPNGWTIISNPVRVANTSSISFPKCLGGLGTTIKYIGIGAAPIGIGELLYYGELITPFAISNNITPAFGSLSIILTEL